MRALILDLWVAGESSGQIAAKVGMTRNAVMGVVHRAGKRLENETGLNPYRRPDQSLNTRNGLRHPGGVVRTPKPERRLKLATVKPPQIKRNLDLSAATPGDRLPPLVKLDQRLWISLPNTTPKDLLNLNDCDCRWPLSTGVNNVGDSAPSPLFCAARKEDDSSYCPTHSSWSKSKAQLAPLNFNKRAA